MKLEFIALGNLTVSKSNMRYARKAPDVSDILPTVRARGVIQPVIVRPNCEAGRFEIIAGCRRFHAAQIVAAERLAVCTEAGEPDPEAAMLPCAVLDAADDASAVEASLIENIARLDPLGQVSKTVLFVVMRGRPTAALTQRAGGGRPAPRIAQRCLMAA
ncbi:ParB/RepB/Spo0J family partition protein [Novosphingobium lindaniclasticum]